MSRTARGEVFKADEIATVHVMNRVVRGCYLLGTDSYSGNNYDYRKDWLEEELERVAAFFGIDCLNFAVLSNHFHLILRSRPDVVQSWDDREVARRWLSLCPKRKGRSGRLKEPSERELCSIFSDPDLLGEIRSRLSDISWWMRLVCQRVAQWANAEDEQTGKFWQGRFQAVRLLDEAAILAGAAYVDLNPIRAALAETLELSAHTSVQRRIEALRMSLALNSQDADAAGEQAEQQTGEQAPHKAATADAFLSPLEIDEHRDELGPRPSTSGKRASDKGYLPMPLAAYLQLLDWTARQIAPGKAGATPEHAPPILERLAIQPGVWCQLISGFGQLFSLVAGKPETIDNYRSHKRRRSFHVPKAARELLNAAS